MPLQLFTHAAPKPQNAHRRQSSPYAHLENQWCCECFLCCCHIILRLKAQIQQTPCATNRHWPLVQCKSVPAHSYLGHLACKTVCCRPASCLGIYPDCVLSATRTHKCTRLQGTGEGVHRCRRGGDDAKVAHRQLKSWVSTWVVSNPCPARSVSPLPPPPLSLPPAALPLPRLHQWPPATLGERPHAALLGRRCAARVGPSRRAGTTGKGGRMLIYRFAWQRGLNSHRRPCGRDAASPPSPLARLPALIQFSGSYFTWLKHPTPSLCVSLGPVHCAPFPHLQLKVPYPPGRRHAPSRALSPHAWP